MSLFAPREAETGFKCPECGAKLLIRRSCGEVWMECASRRHKYPLKDYAAKADEAMEKFLENLYVDRI